MDKELFDKIIDIAQDCVFWKDENRRFLGVNKSFLDYYGFKSADVLIGKTDEDMGWHNDEEPFKQDELRVLKGESTYKVHGKCMVAGVERDIIASKSPVFKNGKVVGLVGSFMDITNAINKKTLSEYTQILYDVQRLRRYKFFDKVLDDNGLEDLLDPTTGLVNRAYALEFARNLIENNIPFSFSILDIDNFKFINDTYGHRSGDKILTDVSKRLCDHLGERGIAGRFGGDELLIIDLEDIDFKERLSFFDRMYAGDSRVFRYNYKLDDCSPLITATIGNATYPEDAKDYDSIFEIMDKLLYHGKSRGRNTYTVYQKDKHENLVVKKFVKRGMFTIMHEISALFDSSDNMIDKLQSVMPLLSDEYHLNDLYYIDDKGNATDVINNDIKEYVGDLKDLFEDDLKLFEDINELSEDHPELYKALSSHGAVSALTVRIKKGDETMGYLLSPERRKHRIWQEDLSGILFYISKLISVIL
ncbi:MAG: GGDEF domain-containing protein [Lachnospiraceae bacterium]|nr:GGDEF domain-containing protein [Lachnospiraceae bacterium]